MPRFAVPSESLRSLALVGDQAREVLRGDPEDEVDELLRRRRLVGVGQLGRDR